MVETVTDFAARAKKSGRIYAALYELGDEQLIVALEGLGNRLDIVLSNSVVTDEKTKKKTDGNENARNRLKVTARTVGPDHAVEPHRAQQVSRTRRQRQGEVRPLRIDELDVDWPLRTDQQHGWWSTIRSWQTATGTIGRQSPPTRTTLRGSRRICRRRNSAASTQAVRTSILSLPRRRAGSRPTLRKRAKKTATEKHPPDMAP